MKGKLKSQYISFSTDKLTKTEHIKLVTCHIGKGTVRTVNTARSPQPPGMGRSLEAGAAEDSFSPPRRRKSWLT